MENKFDVSSEFEPDICYNEVAFFGYATSIQGFDHKWNWNFGDGSTSVLQNPVHKYSKYKTYYIKMVGQAKASHIGCKDSVILTYKAQDQLPSITATANKNIVYKRADSVFLDGISNKGEQYLWEPEEGLNDPTAKNPIAKPQQTTTYMVRVTDANGCENMDEITIHVNPYRCGESEIFIPNAFTPNNDGENDVMRVRGEDIKELFFAIYNRWGETVYESNDIRMISNPSVGWNGTYKGEKASTGVYVYYVRAVCLGDNTFIKKGNITLIR